MNKCKDEVDKEKCKDMVVSSITCIVFIVVFSVIILRMMIAEDLIIGVFGVFCVLACMVAFVEAIIAEKKTYKEGIRPYNYKLVLTVFLVWCISLIVAFVIYLFNRNLARELAAIVAAIFVIIGLVDLYEEKRSEEPGDPGPYWF